MLPSHAGCNQNQRTSKNWRYVCSSLPNLDFNEGDYDRKKFKFEQDCVEKNINNRYLDEFKTVVDQTLLLHDESDINLFKLRYEEPISTLHINSWISFAVRHKVQQLVLLSFSRVIIEQLPACLFVGSTLTMLHLQNVHLKLPSSIRFPLLKSLILLSVKFVDVNQTNKLFSNCCCPILEDLEIVCCSQGHASDNYTVSFSKLKYLNLENYGDVVKINPRVPNLHKFVYRCKEPPNFSLQTLSHISEAEFSLTLPPTMPFDKSATKILMGLGNVVNLTLKGFYIEFLTRDQDLSTCLGGSLCVTLKTLHLHIRATKNQLQATILLLRSYPNIETLNIVFFKGFGSDKELYLHNMEEYWQSKQLSTGDILKHLKTIKIESLRGSENELYLVRFLLMSADSLKNMTIKLCGRNYFENQTRELDSSLNFTKQTPSLLPHPNSCANVNWVDI